MQEFVQKHWKKLVVGGLASTAALLLLLLKSLFFKYPVFNFFFSEETDKPEKQKENPAQEKKKPSSLSASQQSTHDDAAAAQKAQKVMPVIEEETKMKSLLRAYEKKIIKIPEFPYISPEELAKSINVLFEEDSLDLMTISQIFEKAVDLAKNEFVRLAFENRRGLCFSFI